MSAWSRRRTGFTASRAGWKSSARECMRGSQPDGSWWVNNAGAIAGGDSVLVVDTCATAARTRRFLDAVHAATDGLPVRLRSTPTSTATTRTATACCRPPRCSFGHPNMREGLRGDPVIDGCPPLWDPVPDWGGGDQAPAGRHRRVRPDRPPR